MVIRRLLSAPRHIGVSGIQYHGHVSVMNAIQVRQTGSCEALECVEVEMPSPGPGHVLVRVVAASVNYADTMIRKGTYPGMPPLPTIPGLEGSGIVESVGDNVTKVWPGQRVIVFAPHCYAHYVVEEEAA